MLSATLWGRALEAGYSAAETILPTSALRRRDAIRQLSPHLSDPLYRLCEAGKSFIELYECKKERMQAIANELAEISKKIREMQNITDTGRMIGGALGGLGILALGAATYLGGAGKMTMLGGAAVFSGGATAVITANVIKTGRENISLKTVEQLGKDFMEIAELQKDVLEEIKALSEEFEEKSSSFMTRTRAQAERGLLQTEELQQLLTQTAELAEMRGVFIVSITRIIPTSAKLRNCTDSALQCQKTLDEFTKMRNTLKDFEEM